MTDQPSQPAATGPDSPLWYKDAIIYQLHVKSFFDANNDGIGDFQGLIEKLDYCHDLGVTALWLLPFYPSPLRDDGYDIADYRGINPSYGAMRDFRRFVREAHRRNLKVITELVINHTSDQHPWFQRARRAPRGSARRNFYVWSDDDKKWPETRIIFTDTETSNWSWDPVAEQYYWHRFFSHQPDLNFDNPAVVKAIIDAMRFWLDTGVDGLRLDAIPYLVERDGTNNENLPETHEILKTLRRALDESHPHAFFLAEANQWPEDTAPYFGDGDECHMAFHFPLMPRMYMAIAREDRHPITDILRQTPPIPDNCQWAIFLRNHDELTLEMVTEQERDYLWNTYAGDRRARINLGIRRRLAPLMDNDRRKIELMNSLLMSMPGTPIVYYGDEIGMGDNLYVKDRDGVRTPMQWSPDRNGGFSRADPASLFLPAIMDAIYGYDAVNVEAQSRTRASLYHWMRRLIEVRREHPAFGRGTLTFLYPGNRKILAYLREFEAEEGSETILCVANLSGQAQAVELDLSRFRGAIPVELIGRSPFPPIGDLTYLLTLPAYAFYWFVLSDEAEAPFWHEEPPEPLPDFYTLILPGGVTSLGGGAAARHLADDVLAPFVAHQRWFAAKDETVRGVTVADGAPLEERHYLTLTDIDLSNAAQPYFTPLTLVWDESALNLGSPLLPYAMAKIRRGARVGALVDAASSPDFALAIIQQMRDGAAVEGKAGRFAFRSGPGLAAFDPPAAEDVRRLGVEQSNTSIALGDAGILKLYRRLAPGIHPEVEIGRFLTETAGFPNIPALLGTVEYIDADGQPTALAILQAFIRNQGDGWTSTLEYLSRELEEIRLGIDEEEVSGPEERFSGFLVRAATLGARTAALHHAFCTPSGDPAFEPEPLTRDDILAVRDGMLASLDRALAALRALPSDDESAAALAGREEECRAVIMSMTDATWTAAKTRHHGDLHLGQVLVDQDDYVFVDFEGEPSRPLAERRAKKSPLRDLAGLLRSFDYAAWAASERFGEAEAFDGLMDAALTWRRLAGDALVEAYRAHAANAPFIPHEEGGFEALLDLFILEKALYEIVYEAQNRPSWLAIPVQGVLDVLDARRAPGEPAS